MDAKRLDARSCSEELENIFNKTLFFSNDFLSTSSNTRTLHKIKIDRIMNFISKKKQDHKSDQTFGAGFRYLT